MSISCGRYMSTQKRSWDAVSGSNQVLARNRVVINKPLALSASVVLHRYGKRTYSLDMTPSPVL